MGKYSKIMSEFDKNSLPDLDECVLGALEMLDRYKLPKISFPRKKRIGVFGSGNAFNTGEILFEDYDSVYLSESIYKRRLKHLDIDLAVIISASGGKDSKRIAKYLKRRKIKTFLLTNNLEAKARKYVDKIFVFPKQKEPYTYNTSTYLSMIFSKTNESAKKVFSLIKKMDKKIPDNLAKYNSFNIILPNKFIYCAEMFETKFDELFGPKLNVRAFSFDEEKHAKTIISSKEEFFLIVGEDKKIFGKRNNKYNLVLSKNANYGEVISLVYYFIGKIQKQNPPYFKENIEGYVKKASGFFKDKIEVIVE